ncbi:Hypothetical predicted protein [Cloeon dipterum]|uniref:BRICHOS domain-containing protein n=1 Tax=Cloeon dipterum TaxID=197152 RepID=A0A8S1DW24_9INSE|nr:Hypothetical predicted protein [Cloeon dipterum]
MPPSVALLLTFVFVTAPARALEWPDRPRVDLSSQPPASTQKNHHVTQIHSLSDFKYKITAYRDAKEKTCYLQSIASSNNKQYLELYKNVLYGKRETRKIPKTFYTVPGSLSKSQVLHLAGARVASYCRGFTTMILLPGPPQSMTNDFPDSAESPPSEPSLPRYLKEQMQKRRQKRNAKGKRRYQGQTQVQTIALGGDQLNTAESLAQKNTSQTKLSTTRGMSQAQSQSIYEEDCDGCGDRQSNRNGYSWGQIYDQSGQDARVGFRPNEMHTPGRGIHLPNRRPSGQGYDHDKPSGTGLKPDKSMDLEEDILVKEKQLDLLMIINLDQENLMDKEVMALMEYLLALQYKNHLDLDQVDYIDLAKLTGLTEDLMVSEGKLQIILEVD